MEAATLSTVRATRYVAPLREGGSLPALMEADDDGTYVVKFRGAGQGPKALVAEILAGGIGRALGLPIPEIVLVELDPAFARLEMDPEIQHLLRASEGLNLGLDFLPGAIAFDSLVPPVPSGQLASDVVWFDAFVSNIDRTARNTNMLMWHDHLWLIDHGASLYFHHDWTDGLDRARSTFPLVREHALLPNVDDLEAADARAHERLDEASFRATIEAIPDAFLVDQYDRAEPEEVRERYRAFLLFRLEHSSDFVEEAVRARAQLV